MSLNGVPKGTAVSGTTHNVATYQFSEAAQNREIQRICLNDQNGNDITGPSTGVDPAAVSTIGSSGNTSIISAGAKSGWMIFNSSDVDIWIGFNNTASLHTVGIKLYVGATMMQQGIGTFTGAVYARADSGSSKSVRVQVW